MQRFDPAASPAINTWSTTDVPQGQRFEYFSEALSSALIPMRADSRTRHDLEANIASAEFDGVTVIRQNGSAHWSYRDGQELERSGARTFHLIANFSSAWTLSHCGDSVLAPGDLVLTDSLIGHRLEMYKPYEVVHVKLSESWLLRWLPNPTALIGKPVPAGAGWGRALTSFVAQLSPGYMLNAPLPPGVITDHLGGLLAIVGASVGGNAIEADRGGPSSLRERIRDRIVECSADPELDAESVAASLAIGADELHGGLTACGESFGDLLLSARLQAAMRMLQSRSFRSISILEIAVRSGFVDERQLDGALRTCGQLPAASLRARDLASWEARKVARPLAIAPIRARGQQLD